MSDIRQHITPHGLQTLADVTWQAAHDLPPAGTPRLWYHGISVRVTGDRVVLHFDSENSRHFTEGSSMPLTDGVVDVEVHAFYPATIVLK